MNISEGTTAHQIRIILTRTVHKIDTVTKFDTHTLNNLLLACDKLDSVLLVEKAQITSAYVRELIEIDRETLKMNIEVINSAIKLKSYEFTEHGLIMN